MSGADAARALEDSRAEASRALANWTAFRRAPPEARPEYLRPGERLVLLPLSAMTRTLGVLALVETKRKSDLDDTELLHAVATALGLSIENLRDKEELAQTASLLSTTLESTADGILVVGRDGKIESFNAKFAEMWGIPRSILDSRDDDQALAFVLDKLEDPEAFLTKVRELYAQPEGESHDTLVFGRPRVRAILPAQTSERRASVELGFRDVTETKRAEDALSRARRFRALIEKGSDGIALINAHGTVIYAAPSTERLLGYSVEEFVGQSILALVHPDDRERAARELNAAFCEPGRTATAEYRLQHKDGSWHWHETTGTNLLNDPAVNAIVANYRDITERREAEEALKESEEQFRSILESALDAIITMDAEGIITSWNPQAETVFGWTPEETVGRSLAETLIPSQCAKARYPTVIETGEGAC
jgi:two-component system sensor histidine kinase/response regulator